MNEADDVPIDEAMDDDELRTMEAVDAQLELYEQERQDRLWLGSCRAWMEIMQRPNRSEPKERVQRAVDDAVIAACERAARIFRSDLPPVGWDYDPDAE